nr:MAG: hypothetical protein [Bacteriophage sp.]
MKPLEPGCLALVIGGPIAGNVVETIKLSLPPKEVDIFVGGSWGKLTNVSAAYPNPDGTVWYVRCNSPDHCIDDEGVRFEAMLPTKWLMRIDDDSDVKGESNPYVQKLQDGATKKKPLVPLIF